MPQKVRLPGGGGHSTVDNEIHARNVGCVVGRQKRDGAGDFLRLAGATERYQPVILRHHGLVAPQLMGQRCGDQSRAYRVYPDVLSTVVERHVPGEVDDCALGRVVRGKAIIA